MSEVLLTAVRVIEFIAGLTILMLIHEMGHFFAAKLFGVESEEIGLGLPPRIAYIGKFLGTPVSINWLPIGAFVRPKGETADGVPGGLNQLHPLKRGAVFLAGPLFNLAVAFAIFMILTLALGVTDDSKLVVSDVQPGSSAAIAGLSPGDRIVGIDGHSFGHYDDFQARLSQSLGKPLTLRVENGSQPRDVVVVPRESPPADEGPLGVLISSLHRPASIGESLSSASQNTTRYISILLGTLADIAAGKESSNAKLVGLKGLFDVYSYTQGDEVTSQIPGWASALSFFASISLSLGVINLAPVPALDGGRIAFVLPELLLRVKVPRRIENAAITVSMVVLIFLMLYINLRDFFLPSIVPGA